MPIFAKKQCKMGIEKKITSQVSFKKKEEKNVVNFSLESIEVQEEYIPQNANSLIMTNEDVMWNFSYLIEIYPDEEDEKMNRVEITVGISLYYTNDPEQKSIIKFVSCSEFLVTADINEDNKLNALGMLLNIANWNLQGIYISKLEDSPLTLLPPPEMDTSDYIEYFKEIIADEWN